MFRLRLRCRHSDALSESDKSTCGIIFAGAFCIARRKVEKRAFSGVSRRVLMSRINELTYSSQLILKYLLTLSANGGKLYTAVSTRALKVLNATDTLEV